jgi:hypothetical protein
MICNKSLSRFYGSCIVNEFQYLEAPAAGGAILNFCAALMLT